MAETNKPEDFFEDPLENLLDEESDEEFGLPEFKEHLADHLKPAKLKDWTAADFASIYVRFRPHLERHARRFLVNPSQVEEVVQDAFLYLMTTLPELDSEVGVLKFLKWKTRLLALDVIRANSRASFAPIDEIPEPIAKVDDFNQELERADDAAIVAMAMAKLQPRHREALLATMYEEKSQEVVAAQMGLSENALRQLIFRARAAFKKALIGEAETAGKSVSEILSIAARKAAAESGKYMSAAGAFLLVLAISIGVLPNIGGIAPESNFAEPAATRINSVPEETSRSEQPESLPKSEQAEPFQEMSEVQESSTERDSLDLALIVEVSEDGTDSLGLATERGEVLATSPATEISSTLELQQTLTTFETAAFDPVETTTSEFPTVWDGDTVRSRLEVSESIVAFVSLNPRTEVASVSIEIDAGTSSYSAIATWVVTDQKTEDIYRISFADFVFVDRTKAELAPYFSRRTLQVWVDVSSGEPSVTFDFS